ncbi:50S ribosomal protein L28 [candidate division WOR-1 bacterium RIFCSPLOWO2_02_FULL_46_20]|uniref:Large ribosomal subunit protein bL28 n=2 Tax=Saganbacteria TaxID=1703751 RepID=A0A1F4RDK1_UNCSA|nr:MAG: 50S ribosomal protein L28 [candidate division WOR-1 bacterium RIFCSPHIGHO2_02_FULL_45_12]OGC06257.1 MAG: 50S ribosomal protein L28 [candidate division WOR-1 bacterium RIFCSPLOWO2_02_FULL_46_20]OGC09868.1 MAG: 50S ribosomal protein L28 [candidate division WOR-1 bacterium RIFCSPLOWO2_12_FULL_45_9]
MSRRCVVCDKKSRAGNNVSHSKRRTKRLWHPNLQKINIIVAGKKKKEYVCTRCLKAGKVKKAL